MENNLKKPCKDCPFLKSSLPSYLGDRWTANGLHQFVMSEGKFACHNTIKEDGVESDEHEHCVGSIKYMNKNAKRCSDKTLSELQTKFKSESNDDILNLRDFHEHHKDAKKIY